MHISVPPNRSEKGNSTKEQFKKGGPFDFPRIYFKYLNYIPHQN